MARPKEYRAQLLPTEGRHQRLRMRSDMGRIVSLERGGPNRAYIWIGDENGVNHDTISGETALRALAEAILTELAEKK